MQGDLGYRVAFRHLYFALQMSYKLFHYPEPKGSTSAETSDVTGSSIAHVDPYFVLGYEF